MLEPILIFFSKFVMLSSVSLLHYISATTVILSNNNGIMSELLMYSVLVMYAVMGYTFYCCVLY